MLKKSIDFFCYFKHMQIFMLIQMKMVQVIGFWMHLSLFLLCLNCMVRMFPSNTRIILILIKLRRDSKDLFLLSHLYCSHRGLEKRKRISKLEYDLKQLLQLILQSLPDLNNNSIKIKLQTLTHQIFI